MQILTLQQEAQTQKEQALATKRRFNATANQLASITRELDALQESNNKHSIERETVRGIKGRALAGPI